MPELPEVETVCRGLRPVLEGRRLARVDVRRPDLRQPFPENFAARLTGRTVARVRRRGKYFLWDLDDGMVVLGHLGMSGAMIVTLPGAAVAEPGRHDHLRLVTDGGATVTYRDPRRFGLMVMTSGNAVDVHPLLAHMGPEPLDPAFDGPALAARLAGRNTSIKAALLDQRVVAGVGNIYACEALFRAGISPRRKAGSVTGVRATRLAEAIKAVLTEAIDSGGSSLRDHIQVSGELGYFQHNFAVYDREGTPCPGCTCGGGVRRIVQQGRSTFFCPTRQR